ncbi:uncharacterized protein LOC143437466 [Arvicanthis niloticus]|uniref:uncharacterized protein LOC143310424 n=1 Tax=Arvicanthis niloticus TaxID=61156 RepID=UPI00402BD235
MRKSSNTSRMIIMTAVITVVITSVNTTTTTIIITIIIITNIIIITVIMITTVISTISIITKFYHPGKESILQLLNSSTIGPASEVTKTSLFPSPPFLNAKDGNPTHGAHPANEKMKCPAGETLGASANSRLVILT